MQSWLSMYLTWVKPRPSLLYSSCSCGKKLTRTNVEKTRGAWGQGYKCSPTLLNSCCVHTLQERDTCNTLHDVTKELALCIHKHSFTNCMLRTTYNVVHLHTMSSTCTQSTRLFSTHEKTWSLTAYHVRVHFVQPTDTMTTRFVGILWPSDVSNRDSSLSSFWPKLSQHVQYTANFSTFCTKFHNDLQLQCYDIKGFAFTSASHVHIM